MIFIYLVLIIPICFLLTKETYKIFNYISLIQRFSYRIEANPLTDNKDIFYLAEAYINRKLWLSCILLLEKYIHLYNKNQEEFHNCIGFCYLSIGFYEISENHYNKALKINPNNINYLNQLTKIYSHNQLKNKYKLEKIYKKIQEIQKFS